MNAVHTPRRRTGALVTVGGLALAAAVAGPLSGGGPNAASAVTTERPAPREQLQLRAQPAGFRQVDLGKHGMSVGDEVFEHGTLRRSGAAAGRYLMSATLISGPLSHPSEAQTLTLVLPDGRIEAQGQHRATDRYVLAVVGGTGAYAGASGTMHMTGGRRGSRIVVRWG